MSRLSEIGNIGRLCVVIFPSIDKATVMKINLLFVESGYSSNRIYAQTSPVRALRDFV